MRLCNGLGDQVTVHQPPPSAGLDRFTGVLAFRSLPRIPAPVELAQVTAEMFVADVVERADDATL